MNGWEEADLSSGIVQGAFLQRITDIVRDESVDFDVRSKHLNYLLTAIESRKRIWKDEYFDTNNFPTITGQYAALVNKYRDAELEDFDARIAFIASF